MFSALFSFLGGSVFRMIWGELSAYITAKQNHKFEIERLRVQDLIDAAAHERNLASLRLQADLGIKVVQAQAQAKISELDVSAWTQAVADVGKQTGIKFLDIWNGSIRPWLATLASAVVLFEIVKNGFVLTEWDRELVGAILGIYVADRQLSKRGK
jgi:hypothetical protein